MTKDIAKISCSVNEVLLEMTREQRIAVENLIALPLGYLQATLDGFEQNEDCDALCSGCERLRELINGIAQQVAETKRGCPDRDHAGLGESFDR